MKPIALTEKPSQARNVAAAIGHEFADVLAAQGHLYRLQDPAEANPSWGGDWGYQLLWNGKFFKWVPDEGDGKKPRLEKIRQALKTAPCVYVATDSDREGQAIADVILREIGYRGPVKRMIFNSEDGTALKSAFAAATDNSKFSRLFDSAYARHQADMLYGMTLTRAATVAFRRGGIRSPLGVGRVKTPTVTIVVRREVEIRNFRRSFYFGIAIEVDATAPPTRRVKLHYCPGGDEQIKDAALAQTIAKTVAGHAGPIAVTRKPGREAPPRFHDQASLQKTAGKWGWSADKTAKVLQALYQDAKLLTYPGTDGRYLPDQFSADIHKMLEGLAALGFPAATGAPVIRTGKNGHFWSAGLEGKSHYAIIPNINIMSTASARSAYADLDADQRRLFDHVARLYLAAVLPDHEYELTALNLDIPVDGRPLRFKTSGRRPTSAGWKSVYDRQDLDNGDDDEAMEEGGETQSGRLPAFNDGESVTVATSDLTRHQTEPRKRLTEGDLIELMKNAWKTLPRGPDRDRLERSEGIGRPRTRPPTIKELQKQGQIALTGKYLVPSDEIIQFVQLMDQICPQLVSPVMTARWEMRFDDIEAGRATKEEVLEEIASETDRILQIIRQNEGKVTFRGPVGKPTKPMLDAIKRIAEGKGLTPARDVYRDFEAARAWLDQHARKQDSNDAPGVPSKAQLEFAERLSRESGVTIPDAALTTSKGLKAWIDKIKATQPPNEKQLAFARKLSAETGRPLSDAELGSAPKLSAAIDAMRKHKRRPEGAGDAHKQSSSSGNGPGRSKSRKKTHG